MFFFSKEKMAGWMPCTPSLSRHFNYEHLGFFENTENGYVEIASRSKRH